MRDSAMCVIRGRRANDKMFHVEHTTKRRRRMVIYDGNDPVVGLVVAIGVLLVIACVVISVVKGGAE